MSGRLPIAALLSLAALLAASATAVARPVRVDLAIAPQFANSGELWTEDHEVASDLAGDSFVTGAVPFLMNLGSGAASYDFCFTENGYVSFSQTPGCNSLVPPTADNFIAAFANDITISEALWSVGSVDPEAPYVAGQDVPAMRFTWRGTDSGGSQLVAQVVLLDRGVGNFDIELNYGGPFATDYVTSALGQQGIRLGANVQPLVNGPFSGQTSNYFFSMQNGVLSGGGTTPPTDPTDVPEPSGFVLAALALSLFALSRRRVRWMGLGRPALA